MNSNSKILDFIAQFRDLGAENCFSNGMCYWFAHILYTRFRYEYYVNIMYAPIANHFFCKIGHKYYDITGEYHPDEAIYFWDRYDGVDALEHQRIVRDCINKEKI